jgi:hypothetical protein
MHRGAITRDVSPDGAFVDDPGHVSNIKREHTRCGTSQGIRRKTEDDHQWLCGHHPSEASIVV